MFDTFWDKVMGVFLGILMGGCCVLILGLVVFGAHQLLTPPVNTTMVGTVEEKGWNVKPATYWVDIDNTEVDMGEGLWDTLHQGERVRLILSDGYAEKAEVLN